MKSIVISLATLFACHPVFSGQHQFYLNPFSQIFLTNDKGKESVFIEVGDKSGEETIYRSKLKPEEGGVYKSPDGVTFTVTDLPKPQTAGDGTRFRFEAKRKLVITGSGKAFDSLMEKLKADLKDSKNATFYEEGYKP
ncbi:MAG: hypothetical protein ACRCXD_11285 [Luteolibacter sp.]